MTKPKVKSEEHIRVLLVDDHPAFRRGMAALLQSEPGVEVVAEAGDGAEALELYREHQPDLVLMDLRLPGMGGVEATMSIRREFPGAHVIVLTTFDTDEDIYRAFQAGAKAFLLKGARESQITETIRAVHAGKPAVSGDLAARLTKRQQRAELSGRELEILELLIKGRSNKEISSALFISEDTVKTHMKTLFAKLEVKDRTSAAISAVRDGIVHLA